MINASRDPPPITPIVTGLLVTSATKYYDPISYPWDYVLNRASAWVEMDNPPYHEKLQEPLRRVRSAGAINP